MRNSKTVKDCKNTSCRRVNHLNQHLWMMSCRKYLRERRRIFGDQPSVEYDGCSSVQDEIVTFDSRILVDTIPRVICRRGDRRKRNRLYATRNDMIVRNADADPMIPYRR